MLTLYSGVIFLSYFFKKKKKNQNKTLKKKIHSILNWNEVYSQKLKIQEYVFIFKLTSQKFCKTSDKTTSK